MKTGIKLGNLRGCNLFLLGLSALPSMAQNNSANQGKPNILFIAVDDLKPILGCYGDKLIKTPNIDRLAKRGTVFMANYCQQAVSGPTRASLMTGMRPDNTGVWDLKTKMRDVNPDILSLPQYLISQGYSTQGIGKVYDPRCVDAELDGPSWSVPYYRNSDKYISKITGKPEGNYQLPETKALFRKYRAEGQAKGLKGTELTDYIAKYIKPSVENADVPDNAYNDGANALNASAVLAQLAKADKPFFFAVGFSKPHLPFVAPKKYWDMYKRDEMPLAPFQKQAVNSPGMAYHNAAELTAYSDIPPISSFSDQKVGLDLPVEKQKELIHGYYAAISYMDAQVGILLNTIDSLGLASNTIIVLWGDHGWHLGDHNLWCKHTNFEQATRAPLLISAPGFKPSKTFSPSEFIDIFPTLCELSGVPVPKHLDGKSLMPVMKDPKKSVKEYSVSQYPRTRSVLDSERLGWSDGQYMGYSLRTDRYRYTVWMKNSFRSTSPFSADLVEAVELYDYEKDPNETINFSGEKAYSKVQLDLNKKMLSFLAGQVNKNQVRADSVVKALRIIEHDRTIKRAEILLNEKPRTITASKSPRSTGGKHDFYSEGPYWWPDPANPDGPFIRKDGLRFPGRFQNHDDDLRNFSWIVGTHTSAWILTQDKKYVNAAMEHLRAWFIDTATMMNPNMLYAQAIRGVNTGRGVGIIDAGQLMDIAQSVLILQKSPDVTDADILKIRDWFAEFLTWLTTHQYGIDEMNAKNNHGSWWHAQVASYARLTGNEKILQMCRDHYRDILLPGQMASDGSFPEELARTKPYSYSLFNLDATASLLWITSGKDFENWNYTLADGRGLKKGLDYMLPFLKDKTKWKGGKDVDHWESQPEERQFMLFAALAQNDLKWFELWKSLNQKKNSDENRKSMMLKNPLIWIN
jgi:iduronate 2-sulfatase